MKKIFYTVFILAIIFSIAGCSSDPEVFSDKNQLTESIKSDVQTVKPETYNKVMSSEKPHLLVDIREAEDFAEGHIPGAINVPRGKLEFSPEVSNRREVVYLFSYKDGSGYLAAEVLKKMKFKDVFLINSGWKTWIKKFEDQVETGMGDSGSDEPAPASGGGGCGG